MEGVGLPSMLGGPVVYAPGGERHLRGQEQVVVLEKLAGLIVELGTGERGEAVFFAGDAAAFLDHVDECGFEGVRVLVVALSEACGHGHVPGCFSAWAGVVPAGIDGLDMAAEVGEAVGGLFGEAAHIGIDGGVAEVGAPGDAQAAQRGQRDRLQRRGSRRAGCRWWWGRGGRGRRRPG